VKLNAYERLLLPENLNYAWQKAKRLYKMADGYVDKAELAAFELDLENQLKLIHRKFESRKYELKKLRPLPRPKKINDRGEHIDRQYFHVAVEDQVAWIAMINALGPELDRKMPPWSYGNRIFRTAWYEEQETLRSKLEIGPYRHASGHLYRKFQHSWPLFRRHVTLTARAMVRKQPLNLDDFDRNDQFATAAAEAEKLPYLNPGFWSFSERKQNGTDLYCASIDLKQFYPSVKSSAILRGLFAPTDLFHADPMQLLIGDMLRFELDEADAPAEIMENVEPKFPYGKVEGIPTGLFVAGFLANAALIPVDASISDLINSKRSIAHFRFVDDHTILAYDFDELCEWIIGYRNLLIKHDIGADVNHEKYDPDSLCTWISLLEDKASKGAMISEEIEGKKAAAIRDSKIDGANPTRLLTKTLEQVSAIAATNVDVLDDDDIKQRLQFLEWLLLADIPEREIRPDTRAAFAAGKIAVLAPILIQEANGFVDEVRELAHLKNIFTRKHSRDEIREYKNRVADKSASVAALERKHAQEEERHLRHCFDLLFQAFQEFPGKARLFYRLHQYCRLTGYNGLSEIARWIKQKRTQRNSVWGDYYAGLSMQIISEGVLFAARKIIAEDSLRSDRDASWRYLNDVSTLKKTDFFVPKSRSAWFHRVANREFFVSLISVSELLKAEFGDSRLSSRLRALSDKYSELNFNSDSEEWVANTGRSAGVWAHVVESVIAINSKPSSIWAHFESCFFYHKTTDFLASRRYPERLSHRGWDYILTAESHLQESDSGWLRDVIEGKEGRIDAAASSENEVFKRAVKSIYSHHGKRLTLSEWTHFVSTECSPFDPRRSEWTALEIIRQIVSPISADLFSSEDILDSLHPGNILISDSWRSGFPCDKQGSVPSWEVWRTFASCEDQNESPVTLLGSDASIVDYRYSFFPQYGKPLDKWERRLVAIGRVLLGLLRFDHSAPRIWNMRGNEQIFMLPRNKWFQQLAISSPTLRLVESCLGGRSAETRAISLQPSLFGWDATPVNDTKFDPPLLQGVNMLLTAIEEAQNLLVCNQLAVTMNQPRQLIPFRLSDFAVGPDADMDEEVFGE